MELVKIAPFLLLTGLAACLDTNVSGKNVDTSSSGGVVVSTGSGTGGVGTTGTGSGGTTTGGGPSLSQTCTDYFNGAVHIDQCLGATGPFPGVQACETVLAVCSAQDDAILDAAGLCLEGVNCNSPNLEASALLCGSQLLQLSPGCLAAAKGDGGQRPP